MAGHGVDDNPNLKGFARYFNSETNVGRANVSFEESILSVVGTASTFDFRFNFWILQWAKATYAVLGLVIAYNVLKPKKAAAK